MLKSVSDVGRLIRGVSFSWIRFALTIIIGIVQTPLLFHNLNKEQLNFWYIFFLFGAFLQMADLGLVQTLSRLIAYIDNAKESDEKIIAKLAAFSPKQIYATALVSFSLILVIIGVVVFGVYFFTYNQATNTVVLKSAFSIYVVGIIFSLLSNVPAAMLIGYRDVGVESIVRSIAQVGYFGILLLLLPVYKSILLVSLAFVIQSVGQLVALHLIFRVRHKHIFATTNTGQKLIQPIIANQIYSQSFPLVVNQFGGWLIAQGNVLMASIVVGAANISDYAINQQLFTYVTAIALVINQAMGPFIAKRYIQDKFFGLQSLFGNTMIVCLSIVSVMLIVLLSCGENIVSLWVGASHFLGNSFAVVFGLITFLEVQHSVAGNFVWNTGSWPFNRWTLWAGLLTVAFGYVLGMYYGLFGIALATLLSRLLTLNWYVVYFGLRRLGLPVSGYLYHTLSPLILSISVALLVAVFMKQQSVLENTHDLVIILIVSVVSGIVFVGLVAFLFRKAFQALYNTIVSIRSEA